MKAPIISIVGIHKHFGGLVAVDGLSFGVQAGEAIGLMGPNGAGKTTLLNVIAGEYRPDAGAVLYKGRDVAGFPPHKLCHLGIARTYQIPQPFAKLTVLYNIAVAAIYGGGLGKSAAEQKAADVLAVVGLSDKKEMCAGDLEEISLKRLELARVLASDPTLLMIDELAAGLTEEEIPEIVDLLNKINEMGITIILVEHVMKVMMKVVDRIVVMEEGTKIAEGRPDEIMEDKTVIEAYFGC